MMKLSAFFISVLIILSLVATPVFSAGGKNHGEVGSGDVNQGEVGSGTSPGDDAQGNQVD